MLQIIECLISNIKQSCFNIQISGIKYSIFGYRHEGYLRITLGFLGMEENDDLGRYIQARLRAKNIEDKDVAAILNISVKTVHKIYPNKDLYSERVAKFCLILNENIFLDFYGKKEPLKTLLNKDIADLISELSKSKSEIEEYKKIVGILNTQLLEQNSSIRALHEEIIAKSDEMLKLLNRNNISPEK